MSSVDRAAASGDVYHCRAIAYESSCPSCGEDDPALRLGAPWWFLDSPDGIRRFRELVTETAGFYNTAGFVDDTRALPPSPPGTTSPAGATPATSPGRALNTASIWTRPSTPQWTSPTASLDRPTNAFLAGLMFVYTDLASATPFSNNIEGLVYLKRRFTTRDVFWRIQAEAVMYSVLFGAFAAWLLF